MTEIPAFSYTDPVAEIASALRDAGAVIVRDALSPATVDELAAAIEPHFEAVPLDPKSPVGNKKALTGLFGRDPCFSEELLLHPLLLELSDAILLPRTPMGPGALAEAQSAGDQHVNSSVEESLDELTRARDPLKGPNCSHYRVSAGVATQVYKGEAMQPLHREMDIYSPFIRQGPEQQECILTCNWAVTDFTRDNGGTRLVPGSHLWPAERKAEDHEVAQAVMPKGSVVFWLGRTLHAFAPNRTDQHRQAFLMTIAVDWLTQEENQYLVAPPEIARALPYRAQQLLGYRASMWLGWVQGLDSDNMLASGDGGPLEEFGRRSRDRAPRGPS
ncbi:phytanoyl-CoA dioxygenase family protein [Pseudohaliea sp.]|uniref:phytanoyl-CoA dioxygenase family protein n=1 Tax=Pseudohaliea sp. TaxID=2740289 RepID=UPI0032EAF8F5